MIPLSRRKMLRLGGAAVLARPFCRMLQSPARAADTGAKRLIILFTPDGTIPTWWLPEGDGVDYSFGAGTILEPLDRHRSRLIVLGGMNVYNCEGHAGAMAAMLTNQGDSNSESGGRSLDQVVAGAIGGDTRFASLELGVQTGLLGGSTTTRMLYAGPESFVTPDDDPLSVYSRIYGDVVGDPTSAARLLSQRRSSLDLVMDELSTLRGILGGEERNKLDTHLESLRDMERSLGTATCTPEGEIDYLSIYDNDNFPTITASQMQLAVSALSCGATNVVTLQLSTTLSSTVFTWLGNTLSHHSLSHALDPVGDMAMQFVADERWYAEQFATLIDLLEAATDPETGGSLLDTTVVLWAKELGDGREHLLTDVPWVIAGDGGGRWTTGRFANLGGASQASVMVSICHALGVSIDSIGDASTGAGPCDELP